MSKQPIDLGYNSIYTKRRGHSKKKIPRHRAYIDYDQARRLYYWLHELFSEERENNEENYLQIDEMHRCLKTMFDNRDKAGMSTMELQAFIELFKALNACH